MFKFRLRGRSWQVKLVPEKHPDLGEDVGCCSYQKGAIFVQNGMHKDHLRSTLWHEITHAILEPLNDLDEEATCNLVGDAMLELLPQMKRWPAWAK